MTTTWPNASFAKFRIADFCRAEIDFDDLLVLDLQDIPATVTELRRHADLPYFYLLSVDQAPLVAELLLHLSSMRSTCYPYALFFIGTDAAQGAHRLDPQTLDLDIITIASKDPDAIRNRITDYAAERFNFDVQRLRVDSDRVLPQQVDVLIVGAGVVGLTAARRLKAKGISYCVVEQSDRIGGIWSRFANSASQVNSSEGAYRLVEKRPRCNRDHSFTREILEDIVRLAHETRDQLFLNTRAQRVSKTEHGFQVDLRRSHDETHVTAKGVIVAINDRVGEPRVVHWDNEASYRGQIVAGISNEAQQVDWRDKRVAVIGMGAFAIENARTALEGGARQVFVVCRRHGTVCPKIIDYLNFVTPYDETYQHPKKSNMRNMLLWRSLYKSSGATEPECWMGQIKHDGHTISVSDIWFIAHHLKKLQTVKGSVTGLYEQGLIVDQRQRVDVDVIVNCVGFHRNAAYIKELCGTDRAYNINYLDKDLMYLADAYIDNDAFNSFFGSSVLEMAKFYLEVYLRFFDSPEYDAMIATEGIETIPVETRAWSHYIKGAEALISRYSDIRDFAERQIAQRTENFLQAHDLPTYIAQNKREWRDMHTQLAGRVLSEEEQLPYAFDKLLENKA